MKMTIGIPTMSQTLPTCHIGTVCADCLSAWANTYKFKVNVVFILTNKVFECDECQGEELTAREDDLASLAGGFSELEDEVDYIELAS